MAKPTEERVHQDFVAEKCLPFGIVEIRSNNRRLAAVPFLHQFKKDIGLFPPGIDVTELIDQETIHPDQRVEEPARRTIRERGIHLFKKILRPNEASAQPVLN